MKEKAGPHIMIFLTRWNGMGVGTNSSSVFAQLGMFARVIDGGGSGLHEFGWRWRTIVEINPF
jgi:hypothetical protein